MEPSIEHVPEQPDDPFRFPDRSGTLCGMQERPIDLHEDGYRVMPGWRVGHLMEESATASGLLVPAAAIAERSTEALTLVDVENGNRFWAVPSDAWRFIWPNTGRVVIAVRESAIIAEQQDQDLPGEGRYL